MNPNVSSKLKNKLNSILTESQKKEIADKIKTLDKKELEKMIEAFNMQSFSENELLNIIEKAGKSDILSKLKRL